MDINKGASIAMKGKNVKILDKLTGKTISSKIMTKKSSNEKSYISAKERKKRTMPTRVLLCV